MFSQSHGSVFHPDHTSLVLHHRRTIPGECLDFCTHHGINRQRLLNSFMRILQKFWSPFEMGYYSTIWTSRLEALFHCLSGHKQFLGSKPFGCYSRNISPCAYPLSWFGPKLEIADTKSGDRVCCQWFLPLFLLFSFSLFLFLPAANLDEPNREAGAHVELLTVVLFRPNADYKYTGMVLPELQQAWCNGVIHVQD